jgi:hypothetical protein
MQRGQKDWKIWSEKLQKWGLHDLAATLLEGSGPMRIVLAQIMYATSPLLRDGDGTSWQTFADTLDDKERSHSFAAYLREDRTHHES